MRNLRGIDTVEFMGFATRHRWSDVQPFFPPEYDEPQVETMRVDWSLIEAGIVMERREYQHISPQDLEVETAAIIFAWVMILRAKLKGLT